MGLESEQTSKARRCGNLPVVRTALATVGVALAFAGVGAAAPAFEGYTFPLAHFTSAQDATAHGDVHLTVSFDRNGTASACWQFSVFTRERTRYVYVRKATAGHDGPIVDTFTFPARDMPWSGGTGFSGCRGVKTLVARAMVRAPWKFYLDARSAALRHAARAQLRGPAKRCPSSVNCG
jgi:hypothetical protein